MAAGIATGFVRKLYRILDQESDAVISWDASGASFSIHDSEKLNELVLPRYFRGRLSAFRQQLVDHGFEQLECEDDESREVYRHPDFLRGCPGRLSNIVRVPKSKKKVASDRIAAAPAVPPAPTSLRVTLTAVGGAKRSRAGMSLVSPSKKLRADVGGGLVAATAPPSANNPLFSNEPDDGAFSIARLVEGGGLLPASTELPDPISYLNRLGAAQAPSVAAPKTSQPMQQPGIYSDDLLRSALYFLVSTSVTGTETTEGDKKTAENSNGKTQEARSDMLATLLASSTSGVANVSGWGANAGSNPLFSDQSAGDEEDDENSIWNLLVASSVDRVKSAIGDVVSPQEKLRLIIAERERLEEQRKKLCVPAAPASTKPTTRSATTNLLFSNSNTGKSAGNGIPVSKDADTAKPPASNPLFAKDSADKAPASNPLFVNDSGAKAAASSLLFAKDGATKVPAKANGAGMPSEDDLWRLLMSSSIDVFRNLDQFEV